MKKELYSEYALYKGDKLLGIGTIPELSKKLKLNPRTLRWYSSPASRKLNKGNAKTLIRIDNNKRWQKDV